MYFVYTSQCMHQTFDWTGLKVCILILPLLQISALQTVVQRECEEREELLQTVAELKAQRTQTAQKRLKHHQTK